MNTAEIKQIISGAKFNLGNTVTWEFKETTLIVDGKPLTRYSLYEEDGECYLHTESPITTNEDYLITVTGEMHSPFKILLIPKYSKSNPLLLEQEFSF